jgi:hypothetical protein
MNKNILVHYQYTVGTNYIKISHRKRKDKSLQIKLQNLQQAPICVLGSVLDIGPNNMDSVYKWLS